MRAMSCYRRDYVFTKPRFLFLLVGCLGDISQPPLQLGRAIWLSSGWWNAGRSDTFYTQALTVRTFPWDPPLVHPLPLSSPTGGYRTPHALFGSTYTTTGMIQRRLAWPLCKDDEVFHIPPLVINKLKFKIQKKKKRNYMYVYVCLCGGRTYREKHA